MVLGASATVWADEVDHEKAVGAFEEGRRLLEAGNCDAGIHKLLESLGHEPSIGARVSLADCYEPSEPLAAWKQLKEAARLALRNHDERLSIIERRASALEPRLAMIRVVLPDGLVAEAGLELAVDGEHVDPYLFRDGRIATTPGSHEVEARAPGRRWSHTVDAAAASTTTANVKLEEQCPAIRASPAPVPVARTGRGGSRRALAEVLVGAAVAGLGAGAGFGVVALEKRHDLSSACGGDTTRCTAPPGSLDVARESAENAATVSAVGLALGGAALTGAVVLFLVGPKAARTTTTASVRIGPVLGSGAQGMGLVGRW
jgi:hypothetical protein